MSHSLYIHNEVYQEESAVLPWVQVRYPDISVSHCRPPILGLLGQLFPSHLAKSDIKVFVCAKQSC